MNWFKGGLCLFFVVVCLSGFAQSSKELKRKKEALQREIELAQRNLNKTTSGKKLTLGQINALKAQIRLRQEKISTINTQVKNLDNQITENNGKVNNLRLRLADLKSEYAAMIRFAQRNKGAYDKMMFVFASKDFNQAYKRIKYLQQFGQYRKKQANYIEGTKKNLSDQIVVLGRDLKDKSSLLKEQEQEKSKLDKSKSQQSAVLSKLSRQERKYKSDIAQRRKQQAAVDRAIKAAIAREIAAARAKAEAEERERQRLATKTGGDNNATTAPKSTKKTASEALTASPADRKLSSAFEGNRGSLPWPLERGYITSHFGSYTVDQASARNDGVTFQTSEGAAVRAVFNGKVTTVTPVQGKYVVLIKHGEYFTVYYNLRNVTVSKGETVSTKQHIGTVASNDGVPELGFQIHRGGAAQNPESWIAR